MDSVPIPFYADPSDLPAPLPSQQEIHASDTLLPSHGYQIAAVGQHYVVKYGVNVKLIEGENMLFVRRHAEGIRVPQVYALYRDQDNDQNYIVMERIHGETLEASWPSLDEARKEAICQSIRRSLKSLRSMESPGFYGSIGRRPLLDPTFWTGNDYIETINGPFQTEDDFIESLCQKYMWERYYDSTWDPKQKQHFYRHALPRVLKNHRPVFTHGDIQRKNIVITQRGESTENFEVVFLDWETSGFYPSYWEYSIAMIGCGRWHDDWAAWVNVILENFLVELPWVEKIWHETFN